MDELIKKLREAMAQQDIAGSDMLWALTTLFLNQPVKGTATSEALRVLGRDNFLKLVLTCGGQTVEIPTHEDLKEAITAAIVYLEREVNGRNWPSIKRIYPDLQISSIHYAIKLKNMNADMVQALKEITAQIEPQ